jgi:hypothetical protein
MAIASTLLLAHRHNYAFGVPLREWSLRTLPAAKNARAQPLPGAGALDGHAHLAEGGPLARSSLSSSAPSSSPNSPKHPRRAAAAPAPSAPPPAASPSMPHSPSSPLLLHPLLPARPQAGVRPAGEGPDAEAASSLSAVRWALLVSERSRTRPLMTHRLTSCLKKRGEEGAHEGLRRVTATAALGQQGPALATPLHALPQRGVCPLFGRATL